MVRYFYWDPDRAMFNFNLPFLERPLLWYGFFFALGFFIGYWILLYLLKRYLLTFPFFTAFDIIKPNSLVSFLYSDQKGRKEEIRKGIWQRIDAKTKLQISHDKSLDQSAKLGLVKALNHWIDDEPADETLPLPTKVRFLKPFWERLLPSSLKTKMHSRLMLEEILSSSVLPLSQRAKDLAEKITFFVVIGAVVGSRLGDVLFYQSWEMLKQDPLSILKVWEGGLASHGGAAGIFIAILILAKKIKKHYSSFTALRILDLAVIPTALAGCLIRIGNFFNQEILGKTTKVPWAIVFGHPADGSVPQPRHPVQLYEAALYLFSFFILLYVGKKHFQLKKQGKILGLFFILIFGLRFLVEFFKTEQSALLSSSLLTMGQYLSIPFIVLGGILYFRRKK